MDLWLKLSPLYIYVAMGYGAGRFLKIKREDIGHLLIYILSPLTIFKGVMEAELRHDLVMLPILFFVLASILCLGTYRFARGIFAKPGLNILSYAAGNSNSGYFGFPLAVTVLGIDAFPRAVMIAFGYVLFENTVGFYVTARGNFTPRESLLRLARLPGVYTFFIGIALNLMGVKIPFFLVDFFGSIKGAFSVFGMMMIGISLVGLRGFKFDFKFTGFALFMKCVMWPALVYGILFLDSKGLQFFSPDVAASMKLASFLPMAANSVAFATILKTEPEKIAAATLTSTLLAWLILPFLGF